jgi:ubiquinone/menaquinone biosynthesis C-methylase UbiE
VRNGRGARSLSCGRPIRQRALGPGLDGGRCNARESGCGNPLAVAGLREGVLDLGSGGGIDVLLSAGRVGPAGFAYGIDMTDGLLILARANAARAGTANVEFIKGDIEDLPLPDAAVDVVISNCVINLSTNKPAVLAEMFRVLVPGGSESPTLSPKTASPSTTVPWPGRMSGASPALCPVASTLTASPLQASLTRR